MSHVTDVILITPIAPVEAVDEFIKWVDERAYCSDGKTKCAGLQRMNEDDASGSKVLQCEIYAAAFNHWSNNIEPMLEKFESLKLHSYEHCVLIVQDEHDENFRVYRTGEPCLDLNDWSDGCPLCGDKR